MSISPEKLYEIMNGVASKIRHAYNCGFNDGRKAVYEKIGKDISDRLVDDLEQVLKEDTVSVEDYEREVNDLKEDVQQWRDMYQAEHLKVIRLKEQIAKDMPSHNPEGNTYTDWRMP